MNSTDPKPSKLEELYSDKVESFHSVAESIHEGLLLIDMNGIARVANSRFCEITGYAKHEIIGKTGTEIFFPDSHPDRERGIATMQGRHASRLHGVADTYETHIMRKDGQMCWVETKASPLFDQDGAIIGSISAHSDITERKNVEDQLRWSQKMEAVGRLAGGVAHDFNNLLTVIQGYATLLRQQLVSADLDIKRADVILEAAEAASTLTQQLLSISLRQVVQMAPICLNDVIERSLRVVQGLVGEKIEIKVNMLPFLPLVSGDPAQLQQIFLNLVVNARDAMPHGGLLTITTELTDAKGRPVKQTGNLDNTFVKLGIQDSGHGMDQFIKARIFEPFFTTKRNGRGSGLGLAVTFGIVKEHDGEIRVISEPGQGSLFEVLLPVIPAQLAENKKQEDWRPLTGAETILLAEDQIAVRVLLRETFELYGYSVIEAVDGQDAIDLAAHHSGKIDLMITDLVMPRMNGLEAAVEVLKSRPDLKVLVISGYPDEADVWEKIRTHGFAFLAKPFNSDTIAKFVRTVLDKSKDVQLHAV